MWNVNPHRTTGIVFPSTSLYLFCMVVSWFVPFILFSSFRIYICDILGLAHFTVRACFLKYLQICVQKYNIFIQKSNKKLSKKYEVNCFPSIPFSIVKDTKSFWYSISTFQLFPYYNFPRLPSFPRVYDL